MGNLPPHRLIVLGAGFSAYAGIPLATGLYRKVRELAWRERHSSKHYRTDVRRYQEYIFDTTGHRALKSKIDFEKLLTFLDVEHFLSLKGKDTWSEDGNESQLIIKQWMAKVIAEQQYRMTDKHWSFYEKFVTLLDPDDIIITFNYDTILENACERSGTPYKLVPYRYESLDVNGGIIDSSRKELSIFKMHGSIDWYDKKEYDRSAALYATDPARYPRPYKNAFLFSPDNPFHTEKIADDPYPKSSALSTIYRVPKILEYYNAGGYGHGVPIMIMPSHTKMAYSSYYHDFWWSFNHFGTGNSQMIVIGYSFPEQDSYAMQPLYTCIKNYLNSKLGKEYFNPTPLKIVTKQPDTACLHDYRLRLRFIADDNLRLWNTGFSPDSFGSLDELVEPSKFKQAAWDEFIAGLKKT
jgi:hypothetical protein